MRKRLIVTLCILATFILVLGTCTVIGAWANVTDTATPTATSTATSTDSSVDFAVTESDLEVNISDIPLKDKKQMLSVSVIYTDANVAKPTKEQILYANSWYVNGRETMEVNVPNTVMDLSQYRLVVSDTTKSILYSKPIGTTLDIYLNVTDGDTYVITSEKTNVKLNGQAYTDNAISTVGEHAFSYDVEDSSYERTLVAYREGDANVDNDVNVVDLVRGKKYLDSQMEVPNKAARLSSDLNQDGTVDLKDLTLLRKLLSDN